MRENISLILLAALFVTNGFAEDVSRPLSAGGMAADVQRMAQIRDAMVQSLRDRLAKEIAVEPARDFVLRLPGGVRMPTMDGRHSTPIEERRKAKDVEIVLPRRGGKWLPGRATVERFDGRRHHIGTSELEMNGNRITGTLRLAVPIHPHWLSGAIPRRESHPLPEEVKAGWRTDDDIVPLPRLTAYRVTIEIKGEELNGRFEGEDAFGRFEGQTTGTVRAAPGDFRPADDEWTSAEKPETPEQCANHAARLYHHVRALDLMRRYNLPWREEAIRMAHLPLPQWTAETQPAGTASAPPEAMAETVRRMREWVEAAQSAKDAAVVSSYDLSNAQVNLASAQALAARADGAFEMPPASPAASPLRFIPAWQVAGPFAQDDGWAFHTPLLPDIVPAPGAGYAAETERLLAHYRPEPGTLIRWTPAAWAAGALRPPLWGDLTGWPEEQTAAGLRCSRWFAFTRVHSAEARTVSAIFDFDYRGKLFVNGKLVCAADAALRSVARLGERPPWAAAKEEGIPAAPPWRRVCRLDLGRGINELLISCENVSRDTSFSLFLGGGQEGSGVRAVRIHTGWAAPCADAIRRADVGVLQVPPLAEVAPVTNAPAGEPEWAVPGTRLPAQWAQLGPLPDRSDKEMDALRDRVLEMRFAPGAELKDGDRTATFEIADRSLFDTNRCVDVGQVHAARSGTVSYWYVAVRNRFPRTVRPAVVAPNGMQSRLWVCRREVVADERFRTLTGSAPLGCFRMVSGVYPLLLELREPASGTTTEMPGMRGKTAALPHARKVLQVSLELAEDPWEQTEKHLQRMRNCRLLCEWATKELPDTPEAEKARLMLAVVEPELRRISSSQAAAEATRLPGFDRLPVFRIETIRREQGEDPEFVCQLQVAHAGVAQELPLTVRARIPAHVPLCKAAVVNMGMGKYGIYWNKAWFEECRRIECAMIYVDGGFAGKKTMEFARRDGGPLLTEVLRAIAKEAERPELPNLPWVPWGLSGGGFAADAMKLCGPERLLACIPYHGDAGFWGSGPFAEMTEASLDVPVLLFVGGGDMPCGKEAMLMRFLKGRGCGELAAHVREPGVGHVANGPVPLQGAWIEAIMRRRLPADWDPRAGPPQMRAMVEADGWLGNLVTAEIAPFARYNGNPIRAAWLPDEKVARMWQAVVVGGQKSGGIQR